jgi:hypothetical protein
MCHSISTAISTTRSLDEWQSMVEDMRGRGADMDDATAGRIAIYLAQHFGQMQ